MRSVIAVGLFGLASLVGCAADPQGDALGSSTAEASGGGGNSSQTTDNGTHLSVTASVSDPVCLPSGDAEVTLEGILTSTASGAWADVTLTVDGVSSSIDEVLPTDWQKDGRTKTFDYNYLVDLSEGTHTVQICFIQPSGQERMTACSDVLTVVVDCAGEQATCHQNGPFGETIGNKNLCGGAATPHINIQAKGEFGDDATVSISGPNGFTLNDSIAHSGESCVYHYNWATDNNNGGAGLYTFTVTGNGTYVTWNATLFCN